MPILVTYKLSTADNSIQQTQKSFNVTVIIMRMPNIDNNEEIAVNHFTVS